MAIEADKFNEKIQFDGNEYECTFLGKTIHGERVYLVDLYLKGRNVTSVDMNYNPETGNFFIARNAKEIPPEFEMLISDAIQNYHL